MGLIVPLAVYAGIGLWRVVAPAAGRRWRPVVVVLVFCLMLPSTVMAIVVYLVGTLNPSQSDFYYMSRTDYGALNWLQAEAEPSSLVLASPSLSLYLPSRGFRVVYGHVFETLEAEERQQAVNDFYQGQDCSVITREGVDYVVVGPREHELADGRTICDISGPTVYQSSDGGLFIYAVSNH
jgi:hypothetical protein